jgi:hypothetical protein
MAEIDGRALKFQGLRYPAMAILPTRALKCHPDVQSGDLDISVLCPRMRIFGTSIKPF